MHPSERHYLDHAATSWPKAPGALEACIEYQTNIGAAAGRGLYGSAEAASAILKQTRKIVAKWIRAPDERCIAFCSNGTQALNSAILGLLQTPEFHQCHVVTTAMEHNSVLRPIAWMAKQVPISWTAVPCDVNGFVEPSLIRDAFRKETKLVVVNHASNVTGALNKVSDISEIARSNGALLLVDAAQSLGYVPIDVVSQGIDMLAAPGHKGAGGMLGTGLLFVRHELQNRLQPVWLGGTGTASDSIDGPFDWQAVTESGNCNLPAIASLHAGIEWVQKNDTHSLLINWTQQLLDAIQLQPKLRLVGPIHERVPVVSIVSESMSCHEMALLLDSACKVEARSGFHCAGLIHKYLNTHSMGGTLRLSLGHTTVQADVDAALEGIRLLGSM